MLVLKKKAKRFSIGGGIARLNRELSRLPTDTECFKFISDGSFSTICFISAVCLKTRVKSLHVSTFAIGKKEILALKALSDKGRIDYVYFLFQKRLMDYKNGYTELFEKVLSEKSGSTAIRSITVKFSFSIPTTESLFLKPAQI